MLTHKHLLGRRLGSAAQQLEPGASALSTTVSCLLMISWFHQGGRWRLHLQPACIYHHLLFNYPPLALLAQLDEIKRHETIVLFQQSAHLMPVGVSSVKIDQVIVGFILYFPLYLEQQV